MHVPGSHGGYFKTLSSTSIYLFVIEVVFQMSSKIVSSQQIKDEFQQNYIANESSIKGTLAKNIFRITKWNLLKPKYSKIKASAQF